MPVASSSLRSSSFTFSTFLLTILIMAVAFTAGCGSSSSSTAGVQKFSGDTSVNVVLSSTANDELQQFDLQFGTITLTNQSGQTVTVLSAPSGPFEFMHLNGNIEPLTTATVPQGIYTAATATIGSASFTCVTIVPPGYSSAGSLDTSTYAYGYTPNDNVTVNLPEPITITGNSMNLTLDLQVAQSATLSDCYPPGTYAITPTFNLAPATVAAQPTNPANGKMNEVEGQVSALGASAGSFTLELTRFGSPGKTISVTANSNTVYQGITDSSGIQVGTLVDMDGAVQNDGSLLATRIAVYDPVASNVMIGPLVYYNTGGDFYAYGLEQMGQDYFAQGRTLGLYSFTGTTAFQISGQLNNVGSLPFAASVNASNLVPGQNVAAYSGTITDFYGGQSTPVTTVTLMPQTLNGAVESSATSGAFTVYTVVLASYDLFPELATQPGQVSLLTNPSVVQVYVDSNTQKLNATTLGSGGTFRFYGLVFNDNGTLRMDCARVNDGVALTPTASASRHLEAGQVQIVRHPGGTGMRPMITTQVRSH
jgi:Domain of unknown function (DUF5666)